MHNTALFPCINSSCNSYSRNKVMNVINTQPNNVHTTWLISSESTENSCWNTSRQYHRRNRTSGKVFTYCKTVHQVQYTLYKRYKMIPLLPEGCRRKSCFLQYNFPLWCWWPAAPGHLHWVVPGVYFPFSSALFSGLALSPRFYFSDHATPLK